MHVHLYVLSISRPFIGTWQWLTNSFTPDRGEGVNHGIIDGCVLADSLKRAADGLVTPQQAVQDYEVEMRARGKEAVDVSHQSCLDAHDYELIHSEGSMALLGAKKV